MSNYFISVNLVCLIVTVYQTRVSTMVLAVCFLFNLLVSLFSLG